MTTITRAKNRALRNATGVGTVSYDEVKDAGELFVTSTALDNVVSIEGPKEIPASILEPEPLKEEKPKKHHSKSEERRSEIQKSEPEIVKMAEEVFFDGTNKPEELSQNDPDYWEKKVKADLEAKKNAKVKKNSKEEAIQGEVLPANPNFYNDKNI